MNRSLPCIQLILFLLTISIVASQGKLVQLHHQYFYQSREKADKFIVTLFSTDGCAACQKAYHQFQVVDERIQASAPKDVLLTVVNIFQEPVLTMHYNVKEVPIIHFFPYDQDPIIYRNYMEAGSIIEAIGEEREKAQEKKSKTSSNPILSDSLREIDDLDEYKKQKNYSQLITPQEFEKKVLNPKINSLLMLYGERCPIACEWFESLSRMYRNDGNIRFYKLNIQSAPQVVSHFHLSTNPSFVWFPINDKQYGTVFREPLQNLQSLINFLNTQSGNSRNVDGSILPETGRIAELDREIERHIVDILAQKRMKYVVEALETASKDLPHPKRFKDYYVTIVREIEKGRDAATILEKEQNFIKKKLTNKKLSQREIEDWSRYFNIIGAFLDIATRHVEKVKSTMKEEVPILPKQSETIGDQVSFKSLKEQTAQFIQTKKYAHIRDEL